MKIRANIWRSEECLVKTAIINLDEKAIEYIKDRHASLLANQVYTSDLLEHVYTCGGFIEFYENTPDIPEIANWHEPAVIPESTMINTNPVDARGTKIHIQDDCFYFTTHPLDADEEAETVDIPYTLLEKPELISGDTEQSCCTP